jgi:hypothetical protein
VVKKTGLPSGRIILFPFLNTKQSGFGLHFPDRDIRAVAFSSVESNDSAGQRIQRMVSAYTYIFTGMVGGASLADNDIARFGYLAAKKLYTQSFAVRFAPVL